jgi:hypothetical protein
MSFCNESINSGIETVPQIAFAGGQGIKEAINEAVEVTAACIKELV